MVERTSVSEISTSRWNFFQDVIRYASSGINQIGLWRAKVDDFGQHAAVDLLYEMKMSVSSVHWIGGFTGSDGKTFVESIDDGLEAIHLASRVNADCVILHPGSRNGHTRRHANRLITSALQKLGPVAEDFGVKIAIEPMPKSKGPWTFQSFEESLDLVRQFPLEQVGIVLDLYHVGLNASVFDSLPDIIDRVCLVQLADRDKHSMTNTNSHESEKRDMRKSLGEGEVDFDQWLSRFNSCGYEGAFEAELHGAHFGEHDYATMLSEFRGFLDAKSTILQAANSLKHNR